MNAKEHSKKIVYHSLQLAKPSKAKAKASIVSGTVVCVVGITVTFFNKPIGLGLLAAGALQVGVASIVKNVVKK